MNELMVVFGNQGYIYFPTKASNCEDAVEDFINTLKKAGINTDNLCIMTCTLRDGEYNDIDKWAISA